MLTGQRGLEVVGEAANGREALALCRRLQPDLALIDVRMPEMDGLATCRSIKQECPATSVILITVYEKSEYLIEALKAGAAGFLLKDITQPELITSIRRVLRRESLLNSEVVVRLLGHLDGETSSREELLPKQLSEREYEVLRLLVQGKTNPEIAQQLTISVGTVKIHVEHILAKLRVSDRTQAAVRAIELGLLRTTA
ncbi:MAG: response regulator transcription factor [Chloroflexi bacterium]|nr:MAG: response regulator transcription factor [Chloroflexota bacterium]